MLMGGSRQKHGARRFNGLLTIIVRRDEANKKEMKPHLITLMRSLEAVSSNKQESLLNQAHPTRLRKLRFRMQ